jgi:hypothetical protein
MADTTPSDGKFTYNLHPTFAPRPATNRQKKILRFFSIIFGPSITIGGAGWEIAQLLRDRANSDRWNRYLYHTNDFSAENDEIQPFDGELLRTLVIPEGWTIDEEYRRYRAEVAAEILAGDESPFDVPSPVIRFVGRSFMFTGDFDFGNRDHCRAAVTALGSKAPLQKKASGNIDYLVVGAKGSARWSRGAYGNKIETAVLARREHGRPAIISEATWRDVIEKAGPETGSDATPRTGTGSC